MKNLLLHTCCAPCLLIPFEHLSKEYQITLAYLNPNIYPAEEYQRRRSVVECYAYSQSIPLLEKTSACEIQNWESQVGIFGGPYPLIADSAEYEQNLAARQKRCQQCYRVRFLSTAQLAADRGFDCIATTLTISPYQFTDLILEELQEVAASYGLKSVGADYKALYSEATRRSRELDMYRQNYCGCRFSCEEAEIERLARKKRHP